LVEPNGRPLFGSIGCSIGVFFELFGPDSGSTGAFFELFGLALMHLALFLNNTFLCDDQI
jgi:hypothetical protein